jgi:sulfite exporter TauE/SafE
MTEPLGFGTALLLGLASSAHCLGMCGGLTSAMGLAVKNGSNSLALLGSFHLGRILSYALLGGIFGGIAGIGVDWFPALSYWLRVIAGFLLIAMGCYLTGLWQGLGKLEKLGQTLWYLLNPITRHFIPANNAAQALSLGLLWAGLPCGLIYSTLAWSATATHWQHSALLMASFGLGTLPALILSSIWASRLKQVLRSTAANLLIASALIGFGAWTIYSAHLHTDHAEPGQSSHHHLGSV